MCNFEKCALSNYHGPKPIIYRRYVDDTFLSFSNKTEADDFFDWFNKQHSHIKFTKEEENNGQLPFLDVFVSRDTDGTLETTVYRKPTFSGLYMKWDSFVPKEFKRALVNGLLSRAWKICSNYSLLHKEIDYLGSVLISNGYPKTFLDSQINRFLLRKFAPQVKETVFGPEKKPVMLCLPYCGTDSLKLKRQLIRTFSAVAPWINLRIIFKPVFKLGCLSRLKSQLPTLSMSKVVYKVSCHDCDEFYIGKTIRRLEQRMHEHSKDNNSALFEHELSTGHHIEYKSSIVLATDNFQTRLNIKESIKIY